MSGDAEQEYFSDGISEDIITDLSRLSELHVVARNSSFVYKKAAVSVPDVAKALGVRYVLEGSVRKAGNRVRVTAQLIEFDATAGMSGPIGSIATSPTFSPFRTNSPRRSFPR